MRVLFYWNGRRTVGTLGDDGLITFGKERKTLFYEDAEGLTYPGNSSA